MDVSQKTKLPAIFMLIIAILGILFILLSIAGNIINIVSGGATAVPIADPEMQQLYHTVGSGVMGLVIAVFALIGSAFIIFGSIKMMKGESYGLSMAAAILSIVPCYFSCCGLGIPFGIWALVVLMNDEVKQGYR